MASQICELVSHTFYGGRLKVATDKRNDRKWLSEREPFNIQSHGTRNAYLVQTEAEAKYSQSMRGWIRYETAKQVVKFVNLLMKRLRQDDVLVITPYCAQGVLVRKMLGRAGYKRIQVSTVHRAQGSERDTVIFGPVAADNPFLNNEDLGPRLINVAVSRAKARVILFASPENRRNPFISQIAAIIENSDSLGRVDSIHKFINRTDYPLCIIGKTVGIQRKNGAVLIVRVTGLDPSGTKLNAVNCRTGAPTSLSIEHLRDFGGSSN